MKAVFSLFLLAVLITPIVQSKTSHTCESTQYWDGASCVACPGNCGSCRWDNNVNQAVCTSCKDVKFFFDFSNGTTCEKCCDNCDSCRGPQPQHCIQPSSGFLFHPINLQLVQCNVAGCLWCDGDNNCTKCRGDYHLANGGCQKCSVDHCADCGDDVGTCKKCAAEWSLVNGKCSRCGDNCLTCDDQLKCNKCFKGFLLENGACTTCPVHCVACADSSKCDSCFKGYWWDDANKACSSCSPLCKSCSGADTCSECFDGWSLANGKCVECAEGCSSCDENGVCSKCNLGWALNADTKKCEECSDPCCVQCDTKDKCTKCSHTSVLINDACHSLDTCEVGQGLTSNSECSNCTDNFCDSCDNVHSECRICVSGFWADGNKCKSCPKGTVDCWKDESGTFTLVKNIEHSAGSGDEAGSDICLPSLVESNSTSEVGYFCPRGCASCSNKGVCRKCMPGFILAQSLKNWNLECRNLTEVSAVVSNFTICWVDEDVGEPSLVLGGEQGGNEPGTTGPKSATYLTTTGLLIGLILSAML